jgi:hypothetical protein
MWLNWRYGWLVGLLLLVALLLGLGRWHTAVFNNPAFITLNHAITSQNPTLLHHAQTWLIPTAPHHRPLQTAAFQPDNLLRNGSWEFYADGWQLGGNSMITQAEAQHGVQSLAVQFRQTDENFYHVYQRLPVLPLQTYRLTVWVKIAGEVDNVGVDIWDAPRGYQYWYGGSTPRLTGPVDWTPLVLTFTPPTDVAEIGVRLRRFGGHGRVADGTVWFDNLYLEPLLEPLPDTP